MGNAPYTNHSGMYTPNTEAMMPLDVFRPMFTFLKNVSQNSARVQEGMM